VQVRDVMTGDVVTVGPDTPAEYAAEVMAERGFAAPPVVDEADVLRDRLPQDPRLHLIRESEARTAPALLVRGVMTSPARTVPLTADVADVARLFVDARLRSVPVVDVSRLGGIVSRRDLLRTLVRHDVEIRRDVLRLVEGYTQDLDGWSVTVADGVATVRHDGRVPLGTDATADPDTLRPAVTSLARTVAGVIDVRIEGLVPDPAAAADVRP
jgi:CBS domain-containing protein